MNDSDDRCAGERAGDERAGDPATGRRLEAIPSTYDPEKVEARWYRFWEEGGFFRAEIDAAKTPFTIVIPPPNDTGSLHMGHALDNAIQDTLVRWHRMRGDATLWLPGTDHAGIATQHVVEKALSREGRTKEDLGRERFVERVWEWKREYGGQIINQLKRMGASCDWSRLRFTLDEGCSRAVRRVFVTLYNKGLIYQGDYIVNWCPKCGTALSDLEVIHSEVPASLYYVHYPLASGDGFIEVATTRPETMLGDTAVAVNPGDERYRRLVGQKARLPLVGRELPIIADDAVDPEFGTGAVKITPAHDPADFEMARRHDLPLVVAIGADGRMTAAAGEYEGLDREECRIRVVEALKAQGLLARIEDYRHAVGHCYRCDTIAEPRVSRQWFVRMKPLAGPAIDVVRSGRITFWPEQFGRVYINWMENIRDWCISRQIWWGHRVPVWHCEKCGNTMVEEVDPSRCGKCGSESPRQETDVLDTWFSSALWPFSTLGWPDRTPDLEFFFPTSVLVTGYDIIFFWVARMIFTSMEFMGREPFRHALIHGIVRADTGERMSKSRGTGIDPREAIDKYGADALRLGLLTGNTPGNDMRFRWERLEGSRNFCNKLWNAARFTLANLGDFTPPDDGGLTGDGAAGATATAAGLTLADRWILSRFERTRAAVERHLDGFDLGEAARTIYDFAWGEFCDWYIELAKPRLYGRLDAETAGAARATLWRVFEAMLRLLHPFAPFITEELWQALPHRGPSIMVAPWPQEHAEWLDDAAEAQMALLMDEVRAIRNLRAEIKVPPSRQARAVIVAGSDASYAATRSMAGYVGALAAAAPLEIVPPGEARKPRQALAAVVAGAEVYLPLEGLVDVERERERLRRELAGAEDDLGRARARLDDPRFAERAPAEVVSRERERAAAATERAAGLRRRLEELAD